MATNASIILKFSDGTVGYLRNDVTLDTATEVKTDPSGLLNQAPNLSVGQAFQGKTLTHAGVKIQTDSATSGAFGYASIVGVAGNIIGAIQGSGSNCVGLPRLRRPIPMMTGVKINVFAQLVADAVQYASLAVYCASGKVDIFQGLGVDATDVSMVSVISGSTIGEALVNQQVVCYYATYSATNGLADTGVADGINALYVEDAQGQLKAMMYTTKGSKSQQLVPWVEDSFVIRQNDTLTLRANV
jgi:CheY-specific phosphatase CheX